MVLASGMESPESYVSSPELANKRPTAPNSRIDQYDKERPTSIRFLGSNAAAGSVIGKGGSTITELQSQSGTRIQLSRNHEYFPGTTDRIIVVTGGVDDILTAMDLILSKLQNESHTEDSSDADSTSRLRLVVPNTACGGIIGKGGSTIKSFIEDSQAGIKISPQDHGFVGLSDRVVSISGSLQEKLRALYLIVNKLVEDPHYSQYASSPLSYSGANFSGVHSLPVNYVLPAVVPAGYNMINYSSNSAAGKYPINKVNLKHQEDKYGFICEIIDKRWNRQMRKPLHAAALYLNPGLYYDYEPGIESNAEIKGGLFQVINILARSHEDQNAICSQLAMYRTASGGFGLELAINARKTYAPGEWWTSFGYACPELQQFAIRILSLTCSSSPCERNWSTFEMEQPNVSHPTQNSPSANPVTLGIADERIGLVVGRGGRNIADIMQASGARIKISDRGDFISGTSNRKVTISGTKEAIRVAQTLINQRIASYSER